MMRKLAIGLIGALAFGLLACAEGAPDPLGDVRAVVVNSLGEDLSLIGLDEPASVSLGVASLGQAPNQLMALGDELLVLNSSSNSLQVLEPESWQTLREYGLGAGCSPFWMAAGDDGLLVVTCFQSNELLRVDPKAPLDAQAVVARMDMPAGADLSPLDPEAPSFARPQGVLVSGHKAFVTLANLGEFYSPAGPGFVLLVDLAAWTKDRLIELESSNPIFIVAKPDESELWVSCASTYDGSGSIERLSVERGEPLGRLALGGAPGRAAFSPDGVYWAGDNLEGQLLRYDSVAGQVLEPVRLCPSDFEAGVFNFIADVQCDSRGGVMAACFASDEVLWFETAEAETAAERVRRVSVGDGPTSLLLVER